MSWGPWPLSGALVGVSWGEVGVSLGFFLLIFTISSSIQQEKPCQVISGEFG